MTFNSYSFIFIFLPVFLLGVWGIQRFFSGKPENDKLMKLWLIAMSALFFVGYGAFSISVFLISIIWNLCFSFFISKKIKNDVGAVKALKAVAITGNVLLLAGFKFFFSTSMPIAVSFYTFSQIMFIAETGRENNGDFEVLDYLCYILFFPKILQGPIADYKNINDSTHNQHQNRFLAVLSLPHFLYPLLLPN